MHYFESGFTVNTPAWHELGKTLDNPPTIDQKVLGVVSNI